MQLTVQHTFFYNDNGKVEVLRQVDHFLSPSLRLLLEAFQAWLGDVGLALQMQGHCVYLVSFVLTFDSCRSGLVLQNLYPFLRLVKELDKWTIEHEQNCTYLRRRVALKDNGLKIIWILLSDFLLQFAKVGEVAIF